MTDGMSALSEIEVSGKGFFTAPASEQGHENHCPDAALRGPHPCCLRHRVGGIPDAAEPDGGAAVSTYAKPAFGPHRARTPALVARCVIRYVRDQLSLTDIALMENCTSPTIRSILVEAGIEIRPRGGRNDSFKYCRERVWPHNLGREAA